MVAVASPTRVRPPEAPSARTNLTGAPILAEGSGTATNTTGARARRIPDTLLTDTVIVWPMRACTAFSIARVMASGDDRPVSPAAASSEAADPPYSGAVHNSSNTLLLAND